MKLDLKLEQLERWWQRPQHEQVPPSGFTVIRATSSLVDLQVIRNLDMTIKVGFYGAGEKIY